MELRFLALLFTMTCVLTSVAAMEKKLDRVVVATCLIAGLGGLGIFAMLSR